MKTADSPRVLIHLAEGSLTPRSAKTSRGVIAYSPHRTVGVIDSTNVGKSAHELLGVGEGVPVRTCVADFLDGANRPDVLVIGITNPGGRLPAEMRPHVLDALRAGLEVWNGMHEFLSEDAEFAEAARASGVRIWDSRRPEAGIPVGSALCLQARSYICATVGTDAAIGKMTVSLEMQREMQRRGRTAEFVATGQTGMMISGWGHSIDAIPGDFMAGAVEKDCLSVDGRCDAILVEGQGSLYHPGFSSVTLALLHGACPHGLVLCHQPGRTHVSRREHLPLPSLSEAARVYVDACRIFRLPTVLGVCLNTWGMGDADARRAVEAAAEETGLPATDAVRYGCREIVDAMERDRAERGLGAEA